MSEATMRRHRQAQGVPGFAIKSKIAPFDHLLGVLTDREVAALAGVTEPAVNRRRRTRGIQSSTGTGLPLPPLQEPRPVPPPVTTADYPDAIYRYEAQLGKFSDAKVCRQTNVPLNVVEARRKELGIPAYVRTSKAAGFDHLLGKISDAEIARRCGLSKPTVRRRRERLGIAAHRE